MLLSRHKLTLEANKLCSGTDFSSILSFMTRNLSPHLQGMPSKLSLWNELSIDDVGSVCSLIAVRVFPPKFVRASPSSFCSLIGSVWANVDWLALPFLLLLSSLETLPFFEVLARVSRDFSEFESLLVSICFSELLPLCLGHGSIAKGSEQLQCRLSFLDEEDVEDGDIREHQQWQNSQINGLDSGPGWIPGWSGLVPLKLKEVE